MVKDEPNANKWPKAPYKEEAFLVYKYWANLPDYLKGLSKSTLLYKYRITDPYLHELLAIKTQKEFAEKFGIKDLGTLTDWNKRIPKIRKAEHPAIVYLTREMLASLYVRCLRFARPRDVRLFLRLVEDWYPGKHTAARLKERAQRDKLSSKDIRRLRGLIAKNTRKDVIENVEKMIEADEKLGWKR